MMSEFFLKKYSNITSKHQLNFQADGINPLALAVNGWSLPPETSIFTQSINHSSSNGGIRQSSIPSGLLLSLFLQRMADRRLSALSINQDKGESDVLEKDDQHLSGSRWTCLAFISPFK
ncbi:hypothetical protein AVEN_118699-1 [Araneus ventricosus]|uniref:Uncharacterized protein n=1 Tax=Araneus ventricosus TaxID=182803 RepID=A0A4Y2AXS5_ARAVE|nr:hypothetical protein AVEN_118699-1 [Araneus ventricosus]